MYQRDSDEMYHTDVSKRLIRHVPQRLTSDISHRRIASIETYQRDSYVLIKRDVSKRLIRTVDIPRGLFLAILTC